MKQARRLSVSLAAFVLICFFLPWVQLSCIGVKDSVSGFDLARSGDKYLWFLPLLMITVLITGLTRSIWERTPWLFALASTAGGAISAYLMYFERSTTNDSPRLVATQWTVVFWLAFIAALGVIAAGLVFYARASRSP